MVNHKPKKWLYNGKIKEAKAGQCVTSIQSIINKCNCKTITRQKVRTALEKFEQWGFLTIETTNNDTIITIVNWEYYQGLDAIDNQQINQHLTNSQPTDNQHLTTNKNDKNDKNILTISKDIVCHADVQRVVEKWNDLESFGIIAVKRIADGSKRYSSLVARIKQYGLSDVLVAVENIKQSPFLQGKNDKGWTVTFDWFVKPNNFVKVLEGNYINRDLSKSNLEKTTAGRYTEA